MNKHLRVTGVLFVKEAKDILVNKNVSYMLLLPLLFAALYRFVLRDMAPATILLVGTITNFSMVPVCVLSMTIAEEKEKNTLRTLMLANVTGGEFFLGKCLAVGLYTLLVNALAFLMAGLPAAGLPLFLLLLAFGLVGVMALGALVGLVCRDQMSASMMGIPLVMFLTAVPMLQDQGGVWTFLAKLNPAQVFLMLYFRLAGIMPPQPLYTVPWCVGVLAAWAVGGAAAFVLLYRRSGLDKG